MNELNELLKDPKLQGILSKTNILELDSEVDEETIRGVLSEDEIEYIMSVYDKINKTL
jgi:hypothetical protein